MDWDEVFRFVTAIIASIGGAGIIIFALSSWLGKVWATRLLEKEKNMLRKELETTKKDLDIMKETVLRFQNDKLVIYRGVIDVVAKVLAAFDEHYSGRLDPEDAKKHYHEFNQERLRMYGYLGMLAPQSIMDAQDNLMDYLIEVSNGIDQYNWGKVRELALQLLNNIRDDVGIDKHPIEYKGRL